MIETEFLPELSKRVAEEFLDNYDQILETVYAKGKLEEFLEITGLKRLKNAVMEVPKTVTKKFVIIGEKSGKHANDYKKLIANMGLSLENAELHLDYNASKNHYFDKYKNNPEYGAIFFGAHPHKNKDNDGYASIVTKLTKEPGYPKVYLLGEPGHLKLTITSLQTAIAKAFSEGAL